MVSTSRIRDERRRRKKKGKEREKPRTRTPKKSLEKKSLDEGKKQRREARDAFWTKQFAFFPRVDKCSLFNQERENVETHLGKFPFILAVAMIRIFFFFSLDGANVTLRVYLTERIEVSSRSEKRARARARISFELSEREKHPPPPPPKNSAKGQETSPLSSLFLGEKKYLTVARENTTRAPPRDARISIFARANHGCDFCSN